MSYWTLFTDSGLTPGAIQWYCVSTVFGTGEEDTVHNIVSARPYDIVPTVTPLPERTGALISAGGLSGETFNPYAGNVTLAYSLTRTSDVRIYFLDEGGRNAKYLQMDAQEPGDHTSAWTGVVDYLEVGGRVVLAPRAYYKMVWLPKTPQIRELKTVLTWEWYRVSTRTRGWTRARRCPASPVIAFAVTLLMLSMLFVISGCVVGSRQYGRVSTLRYNLRIMPKNGETLPPMVVYVPFPEEEGKLSTDLLRALRTDYEKGKRYFKDRQQDYPVLSFGTVNTQYGKMLMVESKTAARSISATGEYTYATALPIGRADKKYPLEPLVRGKKTAPVYAEYRGGTGFYFWLVYEAGSSNVYAPQIVPKTGTTWVVGRSATPSGPGEVSFPSTIEEDRIEVTKKGWSELPVWISTGSMR